MAATASTVSCRIVGSRFRLSQYKYDWDTLIPNSLRDKNMMEKIVQDKDE